MDFDNSFDIIIPDIQPTITIGGTAGLVFPSGTVAQRNSTVNGTIRFNSDAAMPETYISSQYMFFKVSPSLVTSGIAAAGTAYNTATALVSDFNVIGSASGSAYGVSLPAYTIAQLYGRTVSIYNDTATLVSVYPQSGGTIDGQSANVPVSLASGKTIVLVQIDSTRWATVSNSGITGGGGGAPTSASYITLATDSTLTGERVLQGTTNQITITDGGANGNVTLSIPANAQIADSLTLTNSGGGCELSYNKVTTGEGRVQSTGKYMTLRQTGGYFGATSMILQNEHGMNGVLFKQEGAPQLVDFGMATSTSYTAIFRMEFRTEQQIGNGFGASSGYGEYQCIVDSTGGGWKLFGINYNHATSLVPFRVHGNTMLGISGSHTITLNGQVSVNGSVGTAGQVLASRGGSLSPEWITISGGSTVPAQVLSLNSDASIPNGYVIDVTETSGVVASTTASSQKYSITSTGTTRNWSDSNLIRSDSLTGIAYSSAVDKIVAVGPYGTFTLNAGLVTETNTLSTTKRWAGVGVNGSTFIAVATAYDNGTTAITAARSTGGNNWTETVLPAYQQWTQVMYVGSAWIAHSLVESENIIARSTNGGTSWASVDVSALAGINLKQRVVYAAGIAVIPLHNNSVISELMYSSDGGSSWSVTTTFSAQIPNSAYVTASGNGTTFVSVSNTGQVHTSTDAINWTPVVSNLPNLVRDILVWGYDSRRSFSSAYSSVRSTNIYMLGPIDLPNNTESNVFFESTDLVNWYATRLAADVVSWSGGMISNDNGTILPVEVSRRFPSTPLLHRSEQTTGAIHQLTDVPLSHVVTRISGEVSNNLVSYLIPTTSGSTGSWYAKLLLTYPHASVAGEDFNGTDVYLARAYTWITAATGNGYTLLPAYGTTDYATVDSIGNVTYHTSSIANDYWTFCEYIPTVKKFAVLPATTNTITLIDATDLTTVQSVSLPAGLVGTKTGLKFSGSRLFVMSSSGMAYSTDGQTWNMVTTAPAASFTDVAYGNGMCVAIRNNLSNIYSTSDFTTWTTTAIAGPPSNVEFSGTLFYVTEMATHDHVSTDGLTWFDPLTKDENYSTYDIFNAGTNALRDVGGILIRGYGLAMSYSYVESRRALDTTSTSLQSASIQANGIKASLSAVGQTIVSTGPDSPPTWGYVERIRKVPIVLDFGTVPVYSKQFTLDASSLSIGLSHSPTITADPAPSNIVGAMVGDELECDAIICSASYNDVTRQITIYASALPGPVKGIRTFSLIA